LRRRLKDIAGDDAVTTPTFVLIGAMKAGTVSLSHYLDKHPDVFLGRGGTFGEPTRRPPCTGPQPLRVSLGPPHTQWLGLVGVSVRCVRARSLWVLELVFGGCGGVGAAVGESPADDAWFGLLDSPAACLLGAVVASAFGAEVALAAGSVGVGEGVVEVAVQGLGAAAGGVAGDGAGADDVFEFAAGGVAVLGPAVVAGVLGDGVEGDVEGADQVPETGELVGVGRGGVAGLRRRSRRR
jgi:hypothetical protein